jgi:exopolyphosphatase/guanosine-5'-triphosphate,3'-diphosphate pyrophosphatase
MRPELMIGTSGTILNIANVIHHRRTGEPMTQVIGFSVTEEEIRELHRDLGRYSDGDRERIPGIDPERRDTLLPGTCLLLHLMDELDLKELTLCDRAIREGMILDFIQRNSKRIEQEQEIPNVRRRSVMTLAERCEYEEGHARHTADLSLKLFRAMGLGRALFPNAEEILEYGALLHDIGYHVSYKKHHKHAYYLIKHADLAGFSPEEVDVIACIARYHRKKAPKRGDAALSTLSNRGIRTVRALSAVVRVADALDRSHFGLIRNLKVQKNGSSLRIRVQAAGDPAIELWAADQRKKLLERICGLTVEFVGLPAALQK